MAKVPTARGDEIESGELGFTLMAESLFNVDTEVNLNWPDTFGDVEKRITDAIAALKVAKRHGVDTLVDRSIAGIGRNVPLMKRVALESPVNIIVSTGFYTWRDIPLMFYFRELFRDKLEDKRGMEYYFQRDLEEGIGNTGVRAAILKCATDQYGVTEGVEMVIRAVARVHRRTGAPISTQTDGAPAGLAQQRIFDEEGVDLSRVYIGHVDKTPGTCVEEIQKLIDRGSTVSFDMLSAADLYGIRESRINRIVELCSRGCADRMLLSHDLPSFSDLLPEVDAQRFMYTKYSPWTEMTLSLLPILRERGVTEEQIEQMMVRNPRRIFESRALGPY